MTLSRFTGRFGAAVIGAVVGAVAVLAIDGWTSPGSERRPAAVPSVTTPQIPRTHVKTPDARVLLFWASGGLPAETEQVLERTQGVRSATTVLTGTDWIEESHLPDGTPVDDPERGLAIPWEVALVEPAEYAAFVPPGERDAILRLGPRNVLLAETEATLRGGDVGLQLRLADRSLTVAAVVSDVAANGYEALIAGDVPRSWQSVDRFVLAELDRKARRGAIEGRVKALLSPGQSLRSRAKGETPFLRYGDAVLPQMLIKKTFGEFAARPLPDGRLEVEQAWREANIVGARVPILGRVVCHRALFPQLREALRELVARGAGYVIDPAQYGGCYSPRAINQQPGERLSHHSWGIAIDVNVAENSFGAKGDQDRRLIEVMEKWGFTWGGRWLVPDAMHFEWVQFP